MRASCALSVRLARKIETLALVVANQGLKLLGMFGELQPILGHLDQDRLLLGSVGMLSAPNAFFCLPPEVRGIAHVPIAGFLSRDSALTNLQRAAWALLCGF